MSERERFVSRWSRRKHASSHETAKPAPAEPPAQKAQQEEDAPASASAGGSAERPALAVRELPPIESIAAESDVRAFLAPGVPPELTRAALRRAWSADPTIRDFIGLSENSWDFNDPGAIPGFGPLELTDELRREIARIIGRTLEEKTADVPSSPSQENQEINSGSGEPTPIAPPAALPPLTHRQDAAVRVRQDESREPTSASSDPAGPQGKPAVHRRHGRALPR